MGPRRRPGEDGAATAETALVLPLLGLALLAVVWMITVALAQVRVTDAAREASRAVARGDSTARATELAQAAAPGARVTVVRAAGEVRVEVVDSLEPPGFLDALPAARVVGSATSLDEEAPPDDAG